MAKSRGCEQWARIHNLKQAAKTMNFITEHKIEQYTDLTAKIAEIQTESEQAADALKSVEKRIEDMAVLIKNVSTFQKTNGYSNNCSGIKEKYGLKNGDFCAITQYAIWHFTDGVDSDETGDYSALGVLSSKKTAWDKSRVKKAYLELIDVANLSYPAGAKFNLYLYHHGGESDVQNLITVDVGYTSLSVEKVWEDNNNQDGIRPYVIDVQLLANGVEGEGPKIELSKYRDSNWQGVFRGLSLYDSDGNPIEYSVKEVEQYSGELDGYQSTVTNTKSDSGYSYTITNTHVPETTEISGTKTWDDKDNQDGKRPTAITANLLADGVKVDSKKVTAADNWKYEFKDLPKYKVGQEIKYSVTEEAVKVYETKVSGTDITNIHTPETTDITVTKIWDDRNDKEKKRPDSIKVTLKANDKDLQTVTIMAEDDWKYEFKDLPKYENGKQIKDSVTEEEVTGSTTTIKEDESGNFEITNKIPRDYLFPSTGGSGTISYYVIGLFILLATIFMSIRVRKNKVKL